MNKLLQILLIALLVVYVVYRLVRLIYWTVPLLLDVILLVAAILCIIWLIKTVQN